MEGAGEFRRRAEEGTAGADVSYWFNLCSNLAGSGVVTQPGSICGDAGELGRRKQAAHH